MGGRVGDFSSRASTSSLPDLKGPSGWLDSGEVSDQSRGGESKQMGRLLSQGSLAVHSPANFFFHDCCKGVVAVEVGE